MFSQSAKARGAVADDDDDEWGSDDDPDARYRNRNHVYVSDDASETEESDDAICGLLEGAEPAGSVSRRTSGTF